MNRIDIFNTDCRMVTQTVAPTLPGFQGLKHCIKNLASHPHKLIFYPSNYYDDSNVIRLTWSCNQVECYTTQNYLECHQDADHAIIPNIRRSFSGIIHDLLGVSV